MPVIRIRQEIHDRLLEHKRPGESWAKCVDRLVEQAIATGNMPKPTPAQEPAR